MANFMKLVTHPCIRQNNLIIYAAARNATHWNKDFKPGPFPKTEEERIAAAKKYGILPEEYKAFPDDGNGYGDYPDLPLRSGDSRDSFYPYDFPELKRNFNEPLEADFEMIGQDRYDVNAKLRFPMWQQWAAFLGVMGGFGLIYYLLEDMKMFRPVLAKQYPGNGPHYTFKPAS